MAAVETPTTHRKSREQFLVTASVPAETGTATPPGASPPALQAFRSAVWDTSMPMALGHPFRWALERTEKGIRCRKLDDEENVLLADQCREISFEDLPSSAIPLGTRFWLSIRPVTGMPAVPVTDGAVLIPAGKAQDNRRERNIFAAAVLQVLAGAALIVFWSQRLPESKPAAEEIIPAQFAQTLLSPAFKKRITEQAKLGARIASQPSAAKVLEGPAVRGAIRRLLNSSLSRLDTSAPLGDGTLGRGVSARVFDSGSPSPFGRSETEEVSLQSPGVKLLGTQDGQGNGAGYGTGVVASVEGQGDAQFEMAASREMKVQEGLNKEEVGLAIRKHLGEVRYCYSTALVRNPGAEGKLTVDFVIGASGVVKSAKAKVPTNDDNLNQCILDALVKWEFPKPHGGVDVAVSYPFIFKFLGT